MCKKLKRKCLRCMDSFNTRCPPKFLDTMLGFLGILLVIMFWAGERVQIDTITKAIDKLLAGQWHTIVWIGSGTMNITYSLAYWVALGIATYLILKATIRFFRRTPSNEQEAIEKLSDSITNLDNNLGAKLDRLIEITEQENNGTTKRNP